jgi:hypothetical protein
MAAATDIKTIPHLHEITLLYIQQVIVSLNKPGFLVAHKFLSDNEFNIGRVIYFQAYSA